METLSPHSLHSLSLPPSPCKFLSSSAELCAPFSKPDLFAFVGLKSSPSLMSKDSYSARDCATLSSWTPLGCDLSVWDRWPPERFGKVSVITTSATQHNTLTHRNTAIQVELFLTQVDSKRIQSGPRVFFWVKNMFPLTRSERQREQWHVCNIYLDVQIKLGLPWPLCRLSQF